MEDVVIPTTGIPAELKAATEQTLKRANELKKADPVVSYWCKWNTEGCPDHRLLLGGTEGAEGSQQKQRRDHVPHAGARCS